MYYITNRKPKHIEYGMMVNFKRYLGTTIHILKKGKIRSLKVYGKTIQDSSDLSIIESVAEREDNVLKLKVNESITNINLPQPLRSLPNGVRDTIEGNKLIQRVGKYNYTGKETITLEFVSDFIRFKIIIKDYKPNTQTIRKPVLSDKFTTTTTTQHYVGLAVSYYGCIYIYLDQTIKTVDTCKQWLVENKPTFYYELETPIVHDLTIPTINVNKGDIITTDNNIQPVLEFKA